MEREFLQLFQGYENAYSTYVIKTAQRGNKVETTNKFINGTLEEKHISAHFKGIRGIGSVPLKSDNSLSYGCIDVDDYTINVEELEASVINNELPLLVCYSKSGGAHLFVFFKEPIKDAAEVQELLRTFANKLKLSKYEIFPKQTYRSEESNDIGSSINLPYFNCANDPYSQCCIINGKKIKVDEFINLAKSIMIDRNYISKSESELEISNSILGDDYGDAPPCIKQMLINGIQGGERNNSLFSIGVFLKKKFPVEWEVRLQQVNMQYCNPQLPKTELENSIIKPLNKKDYFYKCSEIPLKLYCSKRKCRKCKFGLSNTCESSQLLSNLTQISVKGNLGEKESVHWILDYDNKCRIKVTTQELNNASLLSMKIQEQAGVWCNINRDAWKIRLSDLFNDLQKIEIDEAYGVKEIFIHTFKEFLMRKTSRTPDSITRGRIYEYEEDNEVWLGFTFDRLQEFYREKRKETLNNTTTYYILKEMGAKEVIKPVTIDNRKISLKFISIKKDIILDDLTLKQGVNKLDENYEKI